MPGCLTGQALQEGAPRGLRRRIGGVLHVGMPVRYATGSWKLDVATRVLLANTGTMRASAASGRATHVVCVRMLLRGHSNKHTVCKAGVSGARSKRNAVWAGRGAVRCGGQHAVYHDRVRIREAGNRHRWPVCASSEVSDWLVLRLQAEGQRLVHAYNARYRLCGMPQAGGVGGPPAPSLVCCTRCSGM